MFLHYELRRLLASEYIVIEVILLLVLLLHVLRTPLIYFTIALFLLFHSASISLSHPLSLTLRSHYSPMNCLSSFFHYFPVSFSYPFILSLPLHVFSHPLLIPFHLNLSVSYCFILETMLPSYYDLQGLFCAPNLKTFKVFPQRDRTAESRPTQKNKSYST